MTCKDKPVASVRVMAVILALWSAAAVASAQPHLPGGPSVGGVWNPVVGSGAVYETQGQGDRRELEIAVVGVEKVQGASGYWLEMVVKTAGGQMVFKSLLVVDGEDARIARMVMQTSREPIEMPAEMMDQATLRQATDIRDKATRVGAERITVPAGTFACQHYRTQDGADFWITEGVPPWGLVKMVSGETTMTLSRVTSNVTSRITGAPRKFDPTEMMRPRR